MRKPDRQGFQRLERLAALQSDAPMPRSFSLAREALGPVARWALSLSMLAAQGLLLWAQNVYLWRIDLTLDMRQAGARAMW